MQHKIRNLFVVLAGIIGLTAMMVLPASATTHIPAVQVIQLFEVNGNYGIANSGTSVVEANHASNEWWWEDLHSKYNGYEQFKLHWNGQPYCAQGLPTGAIDITTACGATGTAWYINCQNGTCTHFLIGNSYYSTRIGALTYITGCNCGGPFNMQGQGAPGVQLMDEELPQTAQGSPPLPFTP